MATYREEEEEVEYELKASKLRHAIKRERSLVRRWELEKDLEELEYDRFMQLKRQRDEKAKREAKEKEEKEYSRYGLSRRDEREYRERQAKESREKAEREAAKKRREQAAKKARIER